MHRPSATRTADSASPRGMSRRRSGSTPAPGAPRRTSRRRVSTGRSPPRPPCSRRSPATSRRWRSSRSTSAGSSTSRTSATLRATILARTGLDEAALLINMSHTHAGANVNSQLTDKPGAELIEPYIEHLTEQIGAAILEAREALAPAWVTYGTGRCALATNRDLWDAEAERFACGYNPDAPADDTLLVARVTGEDGEVRATLFNYACHPTTLAWENRLLSPDYIGAAREVLEQRLRRPGALPPGRLGRSRPARRLRRRHGRRRPQRPPARLRRRGGDREPAAARHPLRLHGDRRVGRQPRHLGVPAVRRRRSCAASEQLAARVSPVELRRKEDIGVVESLSGATPDSVQEREKALRRRFLSAGARRRSRLRDAALDLAARRRAAGRVPERALLGASRSSCGGASPGRRCSCSA